MAVRPVFVPSEVCPFVSEKLIDFKYFSGFAVSQVQRSIQSLHDSFRTLDSFAGCSVLEVSSKSPDSLGKRLSAFNLSFQLKRGDTRPLENVFQSSKVFEDQTRLDDLLEVSPIDAKRDPRLRQHGMIVGFKLEDDEFPSDPLTFFYDWIYCNAIHQNHELRKNVLNYDAFTDIVFNPMKSLNCQARSAAKYVGLTRSGLLEDALASKDNFLSIAYPKNPASVKSVQLKMDF